MILLDTTVLVYATGADHPLRGPCRRLVEAIASGKVDASTTVEVVQEFVHIRGRRRTREDVMELGRAYVDLLAPLRSVGESELLAGLRLHRDVPALGPFDAVLAATALGQDAALVSADTSFASVPRLRHVSPDAESIEQLLAR